MRARQPRDHADWQGIVLHSIDVGAHNKPSSLEYGGYQYATKGERQLAELLTAMSVDFTPDVPFQLRLDNGKWRQFVPDFVFNRQAYVWHGRRRPMLIHGIEAKGKTRMGTFSEKALENVRLLREQRGIVILLLSNAQIKQYFHKGRLPLKRLPTSDEV